MVDRSREPSTETLPHFPPPPVFIETLRVEEEELNAVLFHSEEMKILNSYVISSSGYATAPLLSTFIVVLLLFLNHNCICNISFFCLAG